MRKATVAMIAHCAGQSTGRSVRRGEAGYLAQRQQQASASDGQVDEKDPAPAHSRDQKTAQEGTGGGGYACDGAPQAKGTRALSG